MRVCEWCGEALPRTKRPHARYCSRKCKGAAFSKRRLSARPEEMRAYMKAWRVKNAPHVREVGRERMREWRARNPERSRAGDKKRAKTTNARARERYHIKVYGFAVEGVHPLAKDRYAHARRLGYRSGLEVVTCERLKELGVAFEYEPFRIAYAVAETKHYTPDFVLLRNGIIVETKGRMVTSDRKKHKLIKAQHPDLDLRFVFANPKARISKTSKTTYALWCETNGFQYAAKAIPQEWIAEAVNGKSLAIIERLMENKK